MNGTPLRPAPPPGGASLPLLSSPALSCRLSKISPFTSWHEAPSEIKIGMPAEAERGGFWARGRCLLEDL
jgi:hypothetical protein